MPDSAGNRTSWQQYDITVSRYGGGGGSGYRNLNDFEDPEGSDIIAVYPFDADAFPDTTITEAKNGDDLSQSGGSYDDWSADTSDFVEGVGSVLSTHRVNEDLFTRWELAHANQPSDFPFKGGTTNDEITMLYWFRGKIIDDLPPDAPPDPDAETMFHITEVGKENSFNLELTAYLPGTDPLGDYPTSLRYLVSLWIFNGGWVEYRHDSFPLRDSWYHLALRIRPGEFDIGIWDPGTEAVFGSNKNGAPSADPVIVSSDFFVRSEGQPDYLYLPSSTEVCNTHYDELSIAKTWLSDADILKIRQGTFPL